MNITILGTGALGCLYAVQLCGQHDVELVGRNDKDIAEIERNGVTVRETDGSEYTVKVKVRKENTACDPCDLLIVLVKVIDTGEALEHNKDLIGENTILLSLQNGLGNHELMREYAPEDHILIGNTTYNSVKEGPGRVFRTNRGRSSIGTLFDNKDLAVSLVEELKSSGLDCEYNDNIKRQLWTKLFLNAATNAVEALIDCNHGIFCGNEYARELTKNIIEETAKVAEADGELFDADEIFDYLIKAVSGASDGISSMWQDMQRKKITEVDYINGAVSKLGRKYGIETPINDTIVSLIHMKESLY